MSTLIEGLSVAELQVLSIINKDSIFYKYIEQLIQQYYKFKAVVAMKQTHQNYLQEIKNQSKVSGKKMQSVNYKFNSKNTKNVENLPLIHRRIGNINKTSAYSLHIGAQTHLNKEHSLQKQDFYQRKQQENLTKKKQNNQLKVKRIVKSKCPESFSLYLQKQQIQPQLRSNQVKPGKQGNQIIYEHRKSKIANNSIQLRNQKSIKQFSKNQSKKLQRNSILRLKKQVNRNSINPTQNKFIIQQQNAILTENHQKSLKINQNIQKNHLKVPQIIKLDQLIEKKKQNNNTKNIQQNERNGYNIVVNMVSKRQQEDERQMAKSYHKLPIIQKYSSKVYYLDQKLITNRSFGSYISKCSSKSSKSPYQEKIIPNSKKLKKNRSINIEKTKIQRLINKIKPKSKLSTIQLLPKLFLAQDRIHSPRLSIKQVNMINQKNEGFSHQQKSHLYQKMNSNLNSSFRNTQTKNKQKDYINSKQQEKQYIRVSKLKPKQQVNFFKINSCIYKAKEICKSESLHM